MNSALRERSKIKSVVPTKTAAKESHIKKVVGKINSRRAKNRAIKNQAQTPKERK
jgi:hypothetical protein